MSEQRRQDDLTAVIAGSTNDTIDEVAASDGWEPPRPMFEDEKGG